MNDYTTTQTILDQVAAKFDFSVDKFPLSGPDGMRTPLYGLFRSDNSALVGSSSVTDRYMPHTTDDVLALVEASQDAFGDCQADCHFKDGHYVNLMPSDSMRIQICKNDNVFPRLVIRAGYDGESFRATVGYFRDLCSNLSMIRSVTSTTTSIRHTNGLRDKMNELISQFNNLKQGWTDLTTMIQEMENNEIELDAFLDRIYKVPEEETGRKVTIHRNRTKEIFNRVRDERRRSYRPKMDDNYTVSVWEAYNAVQGYQQHRATRRGKVTPFDRIIACTDDPSVKKAESVAYALTTAA